MKKIVCDRCGDDLEKPGMLPSLVEVSFYENILKTVLGRKRSLDLCRNCFVKFNEFLGYSDSPTQ